MANLIIKSTANDLVIQGSDASPAITVGATGTTTFAENASFAGNLAVTGTLPTGVPKIDNFSYSVEDGPTTSATNQIASYSFTPNRDSSRQLYWIHIAGRMHIGTAHVYMEWDIYDNGASAVKIDSQVLSGGSFPTASDNGNYNTQSMHASSTTALTSGVSYAMRLRNVSSAVNYSGAGDPYGQDIQFTIMCFE
jgi:hypothetical protein